jgi:hypothetical protein
MKPIIHLDLMTLWTNDLRRWPLLLLNNSCISGGMIDGMQGRDY